MLSAIFLCCPTCPTCQGTASFHHVLPTWANVLDGCLDSCRNLRHGKSSLHPPGHSVLNGKLRDHPLIAFNMTLCTNSYEFYKMLRSSTKSRHRQSSQANSTSQGLAFYDISSLVVPLILSILQTKFADSASRLLQNAVRMSDSPSICQ